MSDRPDSFLIKTKDLPDTYFGLIQYQHDILKNAALKLVKK